MRLQMFLLWNAGTKKQIIEYSFILITRSKMRNHISYSCFFRDRCIRIVLVPLNTLCVYGGLWNMGFMWKRFNKKIHSLLLYYWCVRHFCCRCFTSNPCSCRIHVHDQSMLMFILFFVIAVANHWLLNLWVGSKESLQKSYVV